VLEKKQGPLKYLNLSLKILDSVLMSHVLLTLWYSSPTSLKLSISLTLMALVSKGFQMNT